MPKKKADRLEELLTDLVNEMLDNYRQTETLIKKSGDKSLISCVEKNRVSVDGVVGELFKEIGRESAISQIKNDIQGGRRASVRIHN